MIRDHVLLGVGLDNFLGTSNRSTFCPKHGVSQTCLHPTTSCSIFGCGWASAGCCLADGCSSPFPARVGSFTTTPTVYTRALMLGLMASVVDMLAHGVIDASYFVIDLAYVFMLTLAVAQSEERIP